MFKIKNKLMSGGNMGGGGMGGGGMGGGGMGGMANACYTYDKPTDPNKLEVLATETNQISFNREVYMGGSILMDDGNTINIWGFNGNDVGIIGPNISGSNGGMGGMGGGMNGGGPFPSPAIRVTQGQLVHTNLTVNMMLKHTIHHHGIEPDFRSDGVGHTSWDVSGNHTYQWRPSSAGTYFYHCHTNTVLHAEMGMYGALIVDPPEGKGTAFSGGPSYDVEAIWAVDEIDSNWHNLAGSGNMANWTAGLCGEDTRPLELNDLNPDYFIITGVDATSFSKKRNYVSASPSATLASKGISVSMNSNQTLLIRYINAGFMPQQLKLPAALNAEIISSDGHPLRNTNGSPQPYPIIDGKLDTVSAERYDILIKNPPVGNYVVEFDILDWETDNILGATNKLGTAKTLISVT